MYFGITEMVWQMSVESEQTIESWFTRFILLILERDYSVIGCHIKENSTDEDTTEHFTH